MGFYKFRYIFYCLVIFFFSKGIKAQESLGKLTNLRTCFDVTSYSINVTPDPLTQTISGENIIGMRILNETSKIQLDLNYRLNIDSIVFENTSLGYKRDSSVIYVMFNKKLIKGSWIKLKIGFSGKPLIAIKPPWQGGYVWSKDSLNKPWIGLACEGIGPSIWLPCKDHWSDEADSMDMFINVPKGLTGVSNGKLIGINEGLSKDTYHWQVRSPINTYSINVNIGDYEMIQDTLHDFSGGFPLTYYVLRGNKAKAIMHFSQVKTMLNAFERFFGRYPFAVDGYKLVETPYWGMEHQSCVAYGNHFRNNDFGFDFIIIHESAHEWFANSITASDPADMWIHESFTTYAESLFIEYTQGYQTAVRYLKTQRKFVKGEYPMIGKEGVYFHDWKDNDIYYKGAWMLHTMRAVIGNDSAWFALLKGFYKTFEKKIIRTKDVIQYFNANSGRNWDNFFKQYLYQGPLPQFTYRLNKDSEGNLVVQYCWDRCVKGFELPVKVTVTKGKWDIVTPQKSWQLIDLNYFEESDFKVNTDEILIDLKRIN